MQVRCPNCSKTLDVTTHQAGKSVKCPCGTVVKTEASSAGVTSPQSPIAIKPIAIKPIAIKPIAVKPIAVKPSIAKLGVPSPSSQDAAVGQVPCTMQASKAIPVTSMVLGIVSIVFCLGWLAGVPAIITGFVARKRIALGQASGNGFVTAGIVIGFVGSFLTTLLQILTGIGLFIPAAQGVRESARRMSCSSNMTQIGLGLHHYHSFYKQLPATAIVGDANKRLLSWRVVILPFIGEQNLYEEFHHDEPWNSAHNLSLVERMPGAYGCPSAGGLGAGGLGAGGLGAGGLGAGGLGAGGLGAGRLGAGETVYLLPINRNPRLAQNPAFAFEEDRVTTFKDILDGLANTILIVEAGQDDAVIWTKPEDLYVDLSNPIEMLGDAHVAGSHVLMADGRWRGGRWRGGRWRGGFSHAIHR
jgi:hypothetical protein